MPCWGDRSRRPELCDAPRLPLSTRRSRPRVLLPRPPQPNHHNHPHGRPVHPSGPAHYVTPCPEVAYRRDTEWRTKRSKVNIEADAYWSAKRLSRPKGDKFEPSVHSAWRTQQSGLGIRRLCHDVLPVAVRAPQGDAVGERGQRLDVSPGQTPWSGPSPPPRRARRAVHRRAAPAASSRGATGLRYGSSVSTDCQGPDTTRPRGGRIPQSRTTSTGFPADAPCGGTRPTSYRVMPVWPSPRALHQMRP